MIAICDFMYLAVSPQCQRLLHFPLLFFAAFFVFFFRLWLVPGDWLVWAVDSNGALYVRKEVTVEHPAGTEWEHVPGIAGTEICISSSVVWVCCSNGDVLWRNNVSPRNVVGDYWKRVPGKFAHISVTPGQRTLDHQQRRAALRARDGRFPRITGD